MTALTNLVLYQHSLKAANQGSCVRVNTRTGEMITKYCKPWWIELDTGMLSQLCTHHYLLLALWDMAVFKVAEVENAASIVFVVATLDTTFL